MSEKRLPPPISDRKFLCHLSGGGRNIIVTTVMMDFLKYMIGRGNLCDYFDYFSGVSSGAFAACVILLPKGPGSHEPLHPDFRWVRRNVLCANDDGFDFKMAKRLMWRQVVGGTVSSLPGSVKEVWGLAPLFRWLTDPNRLHFSPQKIAEMIEKAMVGPEKGREDEENLLDPQALGLDALLKPFLCPSVKVLEEHEEQERRGRRLRNPYYFHTNQKLPKGFDSGPVNEKVMQALGASSRFLPLLPLSQDDWSIDGGTLFSGIDVAGLLIPDDIQDSDISFFDCMHAPERVVRRKDLQQKGPVSLIASAWEATRGAHLDFGEIRFLREHPNVSYQAFSRYLPENGVVPHAGSVARFMDGFCQTYCNRSYREILANPPRRLDLKSMFTTDREIQDQMINQAVRSCAVHLPDMMRLAERIIQGPLARRYGLSPEQQSEMILNMRVRVHPPARPSYQHRDPSKPWPGFDDSSAVVPA